MRLLDALLGDKEAEAFFSDESDIAAMLSFESGLAHAQAEAGLIPQDAALRIDVVCKELRPDWVKLADGLAKDGVVVPELVKQLRQVAGDSYAHYVHFGATSQDAIDTSLMVRLKDVLHLLAVRLTQLIAVLEILQKRDGAVPLMAHTRMQQALPFAGADKLKTWIAPLERLRGVFDSHVVQLFVIQLGGPVGTRAELKGKGDEIAALLARRLGLNNARAWQSERDRIGEIGSWLSLVSGTLGKIGQDIALMAQNEAGAVKLGAGGASSAMPHKSNPVGAEVLVSLARFNAGLLGTLHQSLVHENERSGAAWTLEWLVLPRMAVATAAALRLALKLSTEIQLNAYLQQ